MYTLRHFTHIACNTRRVKNSSQPSTFQALQAALAACLGVALCFGTFAAAQQPASPPSAQPLTATANAQQMIFTASLVTALDSKKLKVGEEVDLKTTANLDLKNGMTVPHGTKIVGHVTEAKARSKGDAESVLAVTFDRISPSNGQAIEISGTIQAVGPNPNRDAQPGGGIGYGDMSQTFEHPPSPSQEPGRSVEILNPQSGGVFGIKNLHLGADGVLTTDAKSVKLDSGTQIVVRAGATRG